MFPSIVFHFAGLTCSRQCKDRHLSGVHTFGKGLTHVLKERASSGSRCVIEPAAKHDNRPRVTKARVEVLANCNVVHPLCIDNGDLKITEIMTKTWDNYVYATWE